MRKTPHRGSVIMYGTTTKWWEGDGEMIKEKKIPGH